MSTVLPVTLEEIYAFESNLETGFAGILGAAGLQGVSISWSNDLVETPNLSLYVNAGQGLLERQYAIPGNTSGGAINPYTTYEADLVTTVTTNRSSKTSMTDHRVFIAKMRVAMLMRNINALWMTYQQILLPSFVRENGSQYSSDDQRNLDTTEIHWYIKHAINPAAWPLSWQ